MKAYEGRFNFRTPGGNIYDPPELVKATAGRPVTADGVAIDWCWYADTQEGVAKGYIKSDGKPGPELVTGTGLDLPGREVELLDLRDDLLEGKYLLSETYRGKVEIWGDDQPTG